MTTLQLEQLETPCLVIDVARVKNNIMEMQTEIDKTGCYLRPHIKTHKMPFFAHMQIQAGAKGITCAKVSEAEVMAEGGLNDIFIAYPLVGGFRIRRAIELSKHVERLVLAVDSIVGAALLNEEAQKQQRILEVRMEIDTGAGRTGVPMNQAVLVAKAIINMAYLKLTGIYTFKGLMYQGLATTDNALAAKEEGRLMDETAKALHEAGISIEDISAGSSPTGIEVARTGKVTEVRPGTYIFKDQLLCCEHVAVPEEVAVKYVVTVVSTPYDDYAVIDGGSKTFPSDIALNTPPFFYKGYASVEGRGDLCFSRMNEEHGIITSETGKTHLNVGDKLILVPIHVCTAVNMQNFVYLMNDGVLRKQKVEARGMVV